MARPTLFFLPALMCLALAVMNTEGASEVETLVRVPPLQMVDGVLISPDGKAIATLRHEGNVLNAGGNAVTLQLWAIPKGILLWTAKEYVSRLLSFSPDGGRLVGVAEDGTVVFWKSDNGRVKLKLPRQMGSARAGVFLADGEIFLTAMNSWAGQGPLPSSGEIQLWKTRTGRLLRTMRGQTHVISALAISPDGTTLAVGSEEAGINGVANTVNIFDIPTGKLRHALRSGTNVWRISSLAFSPDGKTLVAGDGLRAWTGEIRLWDVATGQLNRTITDEDVSASVPISSNPLVAFSPDGVTLAIVGKNQHINLWNVAADKWRASLEGESNALRPSDYTIQFVDDALLLAKVNPFEQVEIQTWHYQKK
ncbi:MAG TPA: hypothetical protein VN578_11675 [Candidatus Binatia bacterium]|jgi:WD40 repeat protein|nr:hypothetical protein [Candidatus Binatia bacterium]